MKTDNSWPPLPYFLSGMLLGIVAAMFFSVQHYSARIEQTIADDSVTIEHVISNCKQQIDEVPDAKEVCTELFAKNIELEIVAMTLNEQLRQVEISCLLRLHRAEMDRRQ